MTERTDNTQQDDINKFINDIYIYLKSQILSTSYQNAFSRTKTDEAICIRLLERCEKFRKDMLSSVNLNQEQHLEEMFTMEATSAIMETENDYLEMSGTNKCVETPSSEYIDLSMSTSVGPCLTNSEKEIYDLCSLRKEESEKESNKTYCPYLGLPATHLEIQKSPKHGQLFRRIEKRLFFDQTKKYYCGIISDWLLCYSEGILSIRPSLCIQLKGIKIDSPGEGKMHETVFQITIKKTSKKILFQAKSPSDKEEWISSIKLASGEFTDDTISLDKAMNNNLRKLPTPPEHKRISEKSTVEDIYEEPNPSFRSVNMGEGENRYTTFERLPDVPFKIQNSENTKYVYDIPSLCSTALNEDIHQQQPKSEFLTRNKTEFQDKVRDIHLKLSSQLSPEIKKSTPKQKPSKDAPKKYSKTSSTDNCDLPFEMNSRPVKNWLLNRLSKSTGSKIKCKEKDKQNSLLQSQLSHDQGAVTEIQTEKPKGCRINSIIRQLEANGQLPILTKSLSRACSQIYDENDYGYEPIMTTNSEHF